MNAIEVFEQHGLQFETDEQAMIELSELQPEQLWDLTEHFTGEAPIGVSGDEETQANTLRIALVNAFSENSESITQQDIDLAQERALSLIGDVENEAESEDSQVDEPEGELLEAAETQQTTDTISRGRRSTDVSEDDAPKRTRRRTSHSRALIKSLVHKSPNADRDTIVQRAFQQGADVTEETAIMYFYDVRNEMGLPPNGKRGRKPTNTLESVKTLIFENWDEDHQRADIIDMIVSELGYKLNTATVYYHAALKELKAEGMIIEH